MKDQRLLLRKCQLNEIPAVIFQGKDYCALDIMGAAKDIYKIMDVEWSSFMTLIVL